MRAVVLFALAFVGNAAAEEVTFSAEQAAAGRIVFNQQCVGCHDGSDAPVLTSLNVWGHWAGRPAYRLFNFITQFMPADRPGILPREKYLVAMAHLLELNGTVASDIPLTEDVTSMRRLIAPLAPP